MNAYARVSFSTHTHTQHNERVCACIVFDTHTHTQHNERVCACIVFDTPEIGTRLHYVIENVSEIKFKL